MAAFVLSYETAATQLHIPEHITQTMRRGCPVRFFPQSPARSFPLPHAQRPLQPDRQLRATGFPPTLDASSTWQPLCSTSPSTQTDETSYERLIHS